MAENIHIQMCDEIRILLIGGITNQHSTFVLSNCGELLLGIHHDPELHDREHHAGGAKRHDRAQRAGEVERPGDPLGGDQAGQRALLHGPRHAIRDDAAQPQPARHGAGAQGHAAQRL
jgi:hypothetical protein